MVEEMGRDLDRRHDGFCKMLLDRPGNADTLLRERLPAEIVAALSEKPAVDRSADYVDPDLGDRSTDRVFVLEMRDGEPLLVYTMLEHKSRPEPGMLIQTLRNLTGVAERAAVERRNADGSVWRVPAVVIPLVIYNGTRPWTQPLSLSEANGYTGSLLAVRMLHYEYVLYDLFRTPDKVLSAKADLQAGLLALKYAAYDDDADVTARRILVMALPLGLSFFIMALKYILGGSGRTLDRTRLRAILQQLVPNREDEMLTTAALEFMAEAKEEGRKEGRAEGLTEGRTEGLAEGRTEGRTEGYREMLHLVLQTRFGVLPKDVAGRIAVGDGDQLDRWAKRALEVNDLSAVFSEDETRH